MLTKLQLKEIEEIIKRRFLTFSYDALGRRALTLDELEMLRRAGLLKPSVASFTGDAFTLGKIVAAIDRVRAKELGLVDLIKLAERRPITSVEQHAINWASDHTAQYIRGISDSMAKDIGAATARATGAAVRAIQDEVKDTILNRNTVSELQTALFGAIDDKARDWRRVAATEMNNAIQNGVYSAIREERGSHQLVFKRPSPDACVHCKRVYLHTNGMPIVFKMHELTDTNFGAKAREWTATIGSVHPNCFTAGHKISTRLGDMNIEDVEVGHEVLTHKGRWRKVTSVMSRQYDGNLVSLTAGSSHLACTLEHPLLSREGLRPKWVVASKLGKGDYLFNLVAKSKIMGEKIDNKPSVFGQVKKFVGILRRFSFARVPVTSMNFDSNHGVGDGDIDVVDVDRFERFDFYSELLKFGNKHLLIFRQFLQLFNSFGSFYFRRNFDYAASDGFVGGFGNVRSFFFGSFRHSEQLGVSLRPWFYPHFSKSKFHSITSGSDFFRNSQNRVVCLKEFFNKVVIDLFHNSSPFSTIAIANYELQHYSGLVFNFSVEEDESYVCNGVVSHNCQCQLQMLPDGYGFEKQMTVSTPFESGGKGYGRGRIVSTDEYAALNEEGKSKIGYDWIMTYGGLTESLEKSSDSIYHSELDECICSY